MDGPRYRLAIDIANTMITMAIPPTASPKAAP